MLGKEIFSRFEFLIFLKTVMNLFLKLLSFVFMRSVKFDVDTSVGAIYLRNWEL